MPSRTTRSITLTGPDAASFANAQFSSDVLALAPGRWQWSGWLDPKGRVRALLQIARPEDERLVVVPRGGDGEAIANDLRRFVFRSKVKMIVSDVLHIGDGDAVIDMHIREDDSGAIHFGEGHSSLRVGAVRSDDTTNIDAANDDSAWVTRHIEKGYAWLPDAAIDALLPPALSMERMSAVSFNKGCFPGQEIAARLHYLGGHKKHLHVVSSERALQEGLSLCVDGKAVGIVLMCNAASTKPISLVVLDDTAVQADTLDIDDMRLHIVSTFDA
ncbi:MAG TPA: folate-binding protein [Luteibacter sp.]|uniref:CAF17-like 4Fe-4S cluster assembly/insertion protein YgfZ n=1 Tax=Luteibacter sp. TaxID=1886636 RepID=UPI002BB198BC|nr:folate-binding protein [Luteibacter sp.]HVI55772.1 folate-binding protein [Luteibacter sp.]